MTARAGGDFLTFTDGWDAEWEKNLFAAALARLKTKVDPRHVQVFDGCVLQRWPVEEIEKKLRVSSSHGYTIKHRLTALIKEEIRQLERQAM